MLTEHCTVEIQPRLRLLYCTVSTVAHILYYAVRTAGELVPRFLLYTKFKDSKLRFTRTRSFGQLNATHRIVRMQCNAHMKGQPNIIINPVATSPSTVYSIATQKNLRSRSCQLSVVVHSVALPIARSNVCESARESEPFSSSVNIVLFAYEIVREQQ